MRSSPENPPRTLRHLLTPPVVLGLLVLTGCCIFVQFPGLRRKLGMVESGRWFLDSYAVLAASDAARSGLDPFQPNPLDLLERPHSYSRWWFRLGDLGLTRKDNFLLGGIWVVLFFAAVFALLRPRRHAETAWYAVLILSPPVLLAVLRANNDLLIFILLVAGLLAWGGINRREGWFAGALVLATGLKFYPIVAGVAVLLVRPARRMLMAGTLMLAATGLTLASVWRDMQQAVVPWPVGVHTLGAGLLLGDLGMERKTGLIAAAIIIALLAGLVCWRKWTPSLTGNQSTLRERLAFVAGASLLVACFIAGVSHAYRLIFVLLLAPWLWRQAAPGSPAGAPRLLLWLVPVILWLDGALCLFVNFFISPAPQAQLDRLQVVWRLWTQPLHWLVIAILAGWLLDLALRAFRDLKQGEGER